MSRPVLNVVRLGRLRYSDAMMVQRFYVDRLKSGSGSKPGLDWTLLLCEHSPVYTIGLRTEQYPDQDLDRLRSIGAEVHKSDRGGLITFHGPGQLVCYPIIHLGALNKGIRWYVSQLEQTVIKVCRSFGVESKTSPHTGVWVGDKKICAMGIRCSRRVTSHGLALNCDPELSWFDHIVPCGLRGLGVTSLSLEARRRVSVEEAETPLIRAFGEDFGCEVREDEGLPHRTEKDRPT